MSDNFPLKVSTFEGESEDPKSVRDINHGDKMHRDWLGKHVFWACRTGHAVLIEPAEK